MNPFLSSPVSDLWKHESQVLGGGTDRRTGLAERKVENADDTKILR